MDPCKKLSIGAKFLSTRRIYFRVFRHRNKSSPWPGAGHVCPVSRAFRCSCLAQIFLRARTLASFEARMRARESTGQARAIVVKQLLVYKTINKRKSLSKRCSTWKGILPCPSIQDQNCIARSVQAGPLRSWASSRARRVMSLS
jgi:hypothetical protein